MNVTYNSTSGLTTITLPQGEGMAMPLTVGIDLTGGSIRSQINFATPLLLTSGSDHGFTIVSIAGGVTTATMNVTEAQTIAQPSGSYAFDVWAITSAGVPTQILTGSFNISKRWTPLP